MFGDLFWAWVFVILVGGGIFFFLLWSVSTKRKISQVEKALLLVLAIMVFLTILALFHQAKVFADGPRPAGMLPDQPLVGSFLLDSGDGSAISFGFEEVAYGGGSITCRANGGYGGWGETQTLYLSYLATTVVTGTAPYGDYVAAETGEPASSVFWTYGGWQGALLTCEWAFFAQPRRRLFLPLVIR